MGAFEDFEQAIRGSEVIQRVLRSLAIEAAQALRDVCQELERTGKPLPDYRLSSGGYMGEMIVHALQGVGFIEEVAAERRSREYRPTERGQAAYAKLQEEQAFARRP